MILGGRDYQLLGPLGLGESVGFGFRSLGILDLGFRVSGLSIVVWALWWLQKLRKGYPKKPEQNPTFS